jgi:hypothetical protein
MVPLDSMKERMKKRINEGGNKGGKLELTPALLIKNFAPKIST